MLHIES